VRGVSPLRRRRDDDECGGDEGEQRKDADRPRPARIAEEREPDARDAQRDESGPGRSPAARPAPRGAHDAFRRLQAD
jgi:hypothetical protein